MPFHEDFTEFKARMNCEHVQTSTRMLFANGATSDGAWQHVEPPTDELEAAKRRHVFLQVKARTLKKSSDRLWQAVINQTQMYASGYGPHPDHHLPGWQQELEQLATAITALDQEIKALEERLPVRPDPFLGMRQEQAQRRLQAGSIAEKLGKFRYYNPQ